MRKLYIILALVIISLTAKAQYCTTNLYSVGCHSATLGDFKIDSLKFGSLNIPNPPCNTTTSQLGYTDLTNDTTTLVRGHSYNLSYNIISPNSNNYIKAWIDKNNNNIFDTNEVINQQNNIVQGNYSLNISLPVNTPIGLHHMRIRLVSGDCFTGACDTATKGECIDFIVNIVHNYDIGIDSIIIPSDTVICGSLIYPRFKFHNYGDTTITDFWFVFNINNGFNTYGIMSGFNGSLAPDSSLYYLVINPFNIVSNNLNVSVNVFFYGDINSLNDTISKNITVLGVCPITDIGIDSIIIPTNIMNVGDVINPVVKLHNYGNTTISNFPLYYKINNNPQVFDTYTGASIAPGNTAYHIFSTPYFVFPSSFNICASVQAANDVNTLNDMKCKSITVYPAAHDAGVSQVIVPSDTTATNTTIKVKVVLQNFGTNPIYMDTLFYKRDLLASVKEIWTGYLAPAGNIGDTIQYTFNTTYITPAGATFNLCAWSSLPNDAYSPNDQSCKPVYICQPPATPGSITNNAPNPHNFHSGDIITFHVNPVNGAISYKWNLSLPTGSYTIIGSSTDTNITISFGPSASNIGSWIITVQGVNNCGIGVTSPNFNITWSDHPGINELNATNTIKLSPNPTSDKLNINIASVKKGITKFSIYNIQGAKLYYDEVLITTDTYNKIIDVATLKAGIYFIKIENDEGVFNTKFIKE